MKNGKMEDGLLFYPTMMETKRILKWLMVQTHFLIIFLQMDCMSWLTSAWKRKLDIQFN